MKVVINACYGGFGLSHKGVMRYAERKGIKLYPVEDKRFGFTTYFRVPPEERMEDIGVRFHYLSLEDRVEYNRKWGEQTLYDRDIPRDDQDLVAVVEELGAEANSRYAELKVVEIPDNIEWEIDEYDGMETIEEKHRSWN